MRTFSVSKLNPGGQYLILGKRMNEQDVLMLGAEPDDDGYAIWRDNEGNTWQARADYEQPATAHHSGTRLRGSDVDAYREWETH